MQERQRRLQTEGEEGDGCCEKRPRVRRSTEHGQAASRGIQRPSRRPLPLGDLSTAVRLLRAGLAADPVGWVHLALALEEAGDPGAAATAYRDALGHVPADASLRTMAGRFAARYPDLLRAPGRDLD